VAAHWRRHQQQPAAGGTTQVNTTTQLQHRQEPHNVVHFAEHRSHSAGRRRNVALASPQCNASSVLASSSEPHSHVRHCNTGTSRWLQRRLQLVPPPTRLCTIHLRQHWPVGGSDGTRGCTALQAALPVLLVPDWQHLCRC
jgi:hypothetical protein